MYNQLIEVELRDLDGRLCLKKQDDPLHQSELKQAHGRIEESIGGLLCFDHLQLPELRSAYSTNRWVVRIECCCSNHLQNVETRILNDFSDNRDTKVGIF